MNKQTNLKRVAMVIGSLIGVLFAGHVSAATLNLSPSSGSFTVGQTINITLRVHSAGTAINASEGTVTWTPTTLQFVSVSASGSIFKYWPTDPVVRGTSSVIYSGGLSNPGYTGSGGTIFRLTFTAKAAGTGTVSVSGGKVLANDGLGTDVYTGSGTASFTISSSTKPTPATPTPDVPNRPTPVVTSVTHPDQSTWYRSADLQVSWSSPSGLQGVSYSVTADPTTIPSEQVSSTTRSASLAIPSDGTWYFHLRGKYASGWSSTSHFALHLDRTPPEVFTPGIVQDRGTADPTPSLTFSTKDSISGIDKYTYTLDGGSATEASSPVDLTGIAAGEHQVVVTAYDLAGNIREGKATFVVSGYTAPIITSVSTPLVLLDPLIVRGTAQAGDVITILIDGQSIGQVVATSVDATDLTVRVPWVFTSSKVLAPGNYQVTATAASSEGQVSVPTDPVRLHVSGHSLSINGHTYATWSVMTPVAILIIGLLAALFGVLARMFLAVWMMHRRERVVEEELETLRDVNQRQTLGRQQLDSALVQIEEDLDGGRTRRRAAARRRTKKRSSR